MMTYGTGAEVAYLASFSIFAGIGSPAPIHILIQGKCLNKQFSVNIFQRSSRRLTENNVFSEDYIIDSDNHKQFTSFHSQLIDFNDIKTHCWRRVLLT